MLFRIIKKIKSGSLLIKITFEPSDEMPCEEMMLHADEVADEVEANYDEDTIKSAAMIAFEIVNKYRRVQCVDVSHEGETVCCSGEYE